MITQNIQLVNLSWRVFLCGIWLVFIGIFMSSNAFSATAHPIPEEQMDRLMKAVWKEKLHSIDVIVYKYIRQSPKSEEEIRQQVEKNIQRTNGSTENLTAGELERYNRDVQRNIEERMQEQEVGREVKERIRIDENNKRIDAIFVYPERVLLKGTPYEEKVPATIVDDKTPYTVTYVVTESELLRVFHRSQTVYIYPKKESSDEQDILQFDSIVNLLQPYFGDYENSEKSTFVPDAEKIQHARETELIEKSVYFSISTDPNSQSQNIRIELGPEDMASAIVIVSDREDYSKVYDLKIYNPKTGQKLLSREFSNYQNGYPHNVISTEYDLDGNFKEQKIFTFENVKLNPDIPLDVFEFNFPSGYEVYDMRDPNQFQKDAEANAAQLKMAQQILNMTNNTEEIKSLLAHPKWEIRIQALRRLTFLLKDNPEELTEIAESLKDDPSPQVQKVVSEILETLKKESEAN